MRNADINNAHPYKWIINGCPVNHIGHGKKINTATVPGFTTPVVPEPCWIAILLDQEVTAFEKNRTVLKWSAREDKYSLQTQPQKLVKGTDRRLRSVPEPRPQGGKFDLPIARGSPVMGKIGRFTHPRCYILLRTAGGGADWTTSCQKISGGFLPWK